MRQLTLFEIRIPKSFGGESLKGRRKTARPLSTKRPLHLVLKSSSALKRGGFFRHRKWIQTQMEKTAKCGGVQLFERYIGGNHIHLAFKIPSREAYVGFIKALTGALARRLKITFDHRPWTRIVTWGRDFKNLCRYIRKNFQESLGVIAYTPRGRSNIRERMLRNAPPTYEDWREVSD